MSTLTPNHNLIKPELTDPADITAMNQNWDTIDTQLKNLNDALVELKTALVNIGEVNAVLDEINGEEV